ncbi:MAG: PrsW family glutamic-type intramembrane protease [Candidatus Baldrarchaeia archaeon]
MIQISRGHYLASLLLGAAFGFAASLFESTQIIPLLPYFILDNFQLNVYTLMVVVFLAPFAEEITKILPVFFLKTQENIELDVVGWMKLGITSALGFSLLENLSYFVLFSTFYQIYVAIWYLLLRFMLSTPLHLMATTIASYGIGNWDNYGEGKYLAFLAIAMVIHGLFNLGTMILEF